MIRKCTELQPPVSPTAKRLDSNITGKSATATNGSGDNSHPYPSLGFGSTLDPHQYMELDYRDEDEAPPPVAVTETTKWAEDVMDGAMDIEDVDSVYSKQTNLVNDALAYGQELQSEFKDDPRREVKQALEDTFALIAYPDARESSLAPLLEVDGRVPVAEELNCAILGMFLSIAQ